MTSRTASRPAWAGVALFAADGHPPSPRWRVVGWAPGAFLLISSALFALAERSGIGEGVGEGTAVPGRRPRGAAP